MRATAKDGGGQSAADLNVHPGGAVQYRPDIDGLRAIAVISVVIYHFFDSLLPGGYLGVDIFFVISGYLITSIIWREQVEGRFSLAKFYERRVRRLLPALLVVLSVTTIAAFFLLLPHDLIGYARSTLAALAFIANIYFWRDTNYFSGLADEKPILHTWSLGVEEQFYILFPLVLMLARRYPQSSALYVVATLTVGSVALNIFTLTLQKFAPAFYLLPTRAWELGFGALVALYAAERHRSMLPHQAVIFVGLALILSSLVFGRELVPAYVPTAMPACIGTVLVIIGGANQFSLTAALIANRPLVFIGLISYSLYLWHWPILVMPKYFLVRDLTTAESVILATFAVITAGLSWRFIERPFRSRNTEFRHVIAVVIGGLLLISAVMTGIFWLNGVPERFDSRAAKINQAVGNDFRCDTLDIIPFGAVYACPINLHGRDVKAASIAVIGDSYSRMYAPLMSDLLLDRGLRGFSAPINGCLPMGDPNLTRRCGILFDRSLEEVLNLPNIDVVALAYNWDWLDDGKLLISRDGRPITDQAQSSVDRGLQRTIERIRASGRKVLLIGPLATPGINIASIVGRKLAYGHEVDVPLYEPIAEFNARWGDRLEYYRQRNDIVFVQPHLVQCRNHGCDYIREDESLFADTNHLTIPALRLFKDMFETGIDRVLAR